MYSSEDLVRFNFQYQTEAMPNCIYHSIISTVKMQVRSVWEYLGKYFTKIFNGCRDFSTCDYTNFRANECSRKSLACKMYEIVNKQIMQKILLLVIMFGLHIMFQ